MAHPDIATAREFAPKGSDFVHTSHAYALIAIAEILESILIEMQQRVGSG